MGWTAGGSEGLRFLPGAGCFVDDLSLPATLALVLVRSLHAHPAIVGVDVEEARAYRGVAAVVTAGNLGASHVPLPKRQDNPRGRDAVSPDVTHL